MIVKEYKTLKDLLNDKNILNGNIFNVSIYNKGNYDNKIKFNAYSLLNLLETIRDNGNFKYNISYYEDFSIDTISDELKNEIFLFTYKDFSGDNDFEIIITLEIECSDYLYGMFLINETFEENFSPF